MPIDRVTGQSLSYTSATPRTQAANVAVAETPPPPPAPAPQAASVSSNGTANNGRINLLV